MRVERLRPLPSPEQLAAMYPEPHDHRIYGIVSDFVVGGYIPPSADPLYPHAVVTLTTSVTCVARTRSCAATWPPPTAAWTTWKD